MLITLGASIVDRIQYWNVTPEERAAHYPCETYAKPPFSVYLRAINVEAPADHVFRWICQLKLAPYSYDWIDNGCRRSPATLTPGADNLEIGQSMIVATIVDFEPGHQITAVGTPRANRLFGDLAFTYQASPLDQDHTRLLAAMTVTASSTLEQIRRWVLGAGDLVMMRKQLLNLKAHAEAHAQAGETTPRLAN